MSAILNKWACRKWSWSHMVCDHNNFLVIQLMEWVFLNMRL